jgi:hypothetical protein
MVFSVTSRYPKVTSKSGARGNTPNVVFACVCVAFLMMLPVLPLNTKLNLSSSYIGTNISIIIYTLYSPITIRGWGNRVTGVTVTIYRQILRFAVTSGG